MNVIWEDKGGNGTENIQHCVGVATSFSPLGAVTNKRNGPNITGLML
jgi:hypothetical protein